MAKECRYLKLRPPFFQLLYESFISLKLFLSLSPWNVSKELPSVSFIPFHFFSKFCLLYFWSEITLPTNIACKYSGCGFLLLLPVAIPSHQNESSTLQIDPFRARSWHRASCCCEVLCSAPMTQPAGQTSKWGKWQSSSLSRLFRIFIPPEISKH